MIELQHTMSCWRLQGLLVGAWQPAGTSAGALQHVQWRWLCWRRQWLCQDTGLQCHCCTGLTQPVLRGCAAQASGCRVPALCRGGAQQAHREAAGGSMGTHMASPAMSRHHHDIDKGWLVDGCLYRTYCAERTQAVVPASGTAAAGSVSGLGVICVFPPGLWCATVLGIPCQCAVGAAGGPMFTASADAECIQHLQAEWPWLLPLSTTQTCGACAARLRRSGYVCVRARS
jgi:hypothetical protein